MRCAISIVYSQTRLLTKLTLAEIRTHAKRFLSNDCKALRRRHAQHKRNVPIDTAAARKVARRRKRVVQADRSARKKSRNDFNARRHPSRRAGRDTQQRRRGAQCGAHRQLRERDVNGRVDVDGRRRRNERQRYTALIRHDNRNTGGRR